MRAKYLDFARNNSHFAHVSQRIHPAEPERFSLRNITGNSNPSASEGLQRCPPRPTAAIYGDCPGDPSSPLLSGWQIGHGRSLRSPLLWTTPIIQPGQSGTATSNLWRRWCVGVPAVSTTIAGAAAKSLTPEAILTLEIAEDLAPRSISAAAVISLAIPVPSQERAHRHATTLGWRLAKSYPCPYHDASTAVTSSEYPSQRRQKNDDPINRRATVALTAKPRSATSSTSAAVARYWPISPLAMAVNSVMALPNSFSTRGNAWHSLTPWLFLALAIFWPLQKSPCDAGN